MIFQHHLLFVCCVCLALAILLSTVAANPAAGRDRHQIRAAAAAVRGWPVQYYRRAYLSSSDKQQDRVRFLIRPDWWTRKRFENGQQSFYKANNYIFYS